MKGNEIERRKGNTEKIFDGSASQTERIIVLESTRGAISSQEGNLRKEGGM
jgi:hypothetical protein